MANVLFAALIHETNSFVPGLTGTKAFGEESSLGGVLRGDDILPALAHNSCIRGFEAHARSGHSLMPLFYAEAEPGPPVAAAFFEQMAGELTDAIRTRGPDAVYLDLHGAMIAEHDDDGDARLIERVREATGPGVPIVATLDLHANLSDRFVAAADLLIAYRTYPHIDMRARGLEAAQLLDMLLAQPTRRPHAALRHASFMLPINRQYSEAGPMAEVMALLDDIPTRERANGLISLSLTAGFQPADIKAPLPAALAYAWDASVAERCADELMAALSKREGEFDFDYIGADAAAERAARFAGSSGLFIADAQDNPGGGGSADTMFVVRALAEADVADALVAMVHDPVAAKAAHDAGIGARIDVALGGRTVPGDHPIDDTFEVRALASGGVSLDGVMMGGAKVDIGPAALLRWQGIDIAVSAKRTQCLERGYLRHLGIDPATYRVVVLKDALHYRADFAPLITEVINVIAPGFEAMDFSQLPYTKLRPGVRYWGGGPAHG